ncbi:MAG: right-handed parallel beta-helix repeat-containing protein [Anaerolineae bacterium]|nr:right-handed parallel beta-helix repeat-containing protein [Anaerolineae bacterium]
MTTPTDGMIITEDTTLEPGVYFLPNGLKIAASHITLDGNGATLIGRDRQGRGVQIDGQHHVTIKNLHLRDYYHGIHAQHCQQLSITDCQVASTAEVAANTIFLDIWLDAQHAYGGGILLSEVEDSTLTRNDLQHQMNGLLTYDCQRLTVSHNNASYCSGFGIHLYATSDSIFEENFADYCSRWQPRGERTGHMGADATGFLILAGSSRNIFRRNYARLGGDGFFLAGLDPHFNFRPCNNNIFDENDASYSPNIAFEATFSADNIYRNNSANYCNYGFWLGFSATNVLQDNQINYCAQAGVAVENGYGFVVRENRFYGSTHGILLWSKHIPQFGSVVPENNTSYNWVSKTTHSTGMIKQFGLLPIRIMVFAPSHRAHRSRTTT